MLEQASVVAVEEVAKSTLLGSAKALIANNPVTSAVAGTVLLGGIGYGLYRLYKNNQKQEPFVVSAETAAIAEKAGEA